MEPICSQPRSVAHERQKVTLLKSKDRNMQFWQAVSQFSHGRHEFEQSLIPR
jgi:hypothetical protein